MEPIRTDLAVERTAAAPSLPGVTQETRGNAFSVTEIRIKNVSAERGLQPDSECSV